MVFRVALGDPTLVLFVASSSKVAWFTGYGGAAVFGSVCADQLQCCWTHFTFNSLRDWHVAINNYGLSWFLCRKVYSFVDDYHSGAVDLNAFVGMPRESVYGVICPHSCVILPAILAVHIQSTTVWTCRHSDALRYVVASTCITSVESL